MLSREVNSVDHDLYRAVTLKETGQLHAATEQSDDQKTTAAIAMVI